MHTSQVAVYIYVCQVPGRHKKHTVTTQNRVWQTPGIPGLREPLTSAGPPGVMELMMVPRSIRPEFSPPTTWNPGEHTRANKCQNTHTHTDIASLILDSTVRWEVGAECIYPPSPRPYFTSFFRFTVETSLSGDGKALSFFFRESEEHKYTVFVLLTGIHWYTELALSFVIWHMSNSGFHRGYSVGRYNDSVTQSTV